MAARKRTKFRIEQDRARIASLYLKGRTQLEVAEELGMTRQMVGYDLEAVKEKWRAQRINDIDLLTGRELAKIALREREAWEAWEKSKQERVITSTKQTNGTKQEMVRKEQRTGDAVYLDALHKCSDQCCRILGLYMPTHLTHLTTAELDAEIERELKRLAGKQDDEEGESDPIC